MLLRLLQPNFIGEFIHYMIGVSYRKNVYQSTLDTEDIYDIDIIYNIDGSIDVIVIYLSEVETILIRDSSYNTKQPKKHSIIWKVLILLARQN